MQRNLTSYVLEAWKNKIERKKRDRILSAHIRENSRINLRSYLLYQWLSKTQENRIFTQMGSFYKMKVVRSVVREWREIKNRKNAKRLRTHRIREQLKERPELGRPLKAMRNMTMFKAFNKLVEGA